MADDARWASFSSDWIATSTRLPLRYVQKTMSRLRQRGMLTRIRQPRPVTGGFRRGCMNLYSVTLRGRERAAWWKQSNSMMGFHYLANGVGDSRESCDSVGTKFIASKFSMPEAWRFRCRDPNATSALLTCLDMRNLPTSLFANTPLAAPAAAMALKTRGILPDSVVKDLPVFLATAKGNYRCSDMQILIALLYRSAAYWRNECETYSEAFLHALDCTVELRKRLDQETPTQQELLAEERRRNSELSFENASLKVEKSLQAKKLRDWVSTNSTMLNNLSTELRKFNKSTNDLFVSLVIWHVSYMISLIVLFNHAAILNS